jgi:hypothetical protein
LVCFPFHHVFKLPFACIVDLYGHLSSFVVSNPVPAAAPAAAAAAAAANAAVAEAAACEEAVELAVWPVTEGKW